MFYEFSLTVPADTEADDPEELDVHLTHGVITYIEIEFAPGCHRLVEAYVRDGLHQLVPTNPDETIKSSGRAVAFQEYYELLSPPYLLTIGGFSPGTSYDHDIIFRFEVTPQEIAERGKTSQGMLDKIGRLLGLVR
jgi:hypothetical protein